MGERMMAGMLWVGVAAGLAIAVPAAADVKAGVDAWGRGDFRHAVEEWRGPAVAGDADAQFNLGQAYKLGRGVPVDPALAESWFRKAAAQGHLQAGENYGLALFQAGRKADAVPWLEKSATRGEPRAQLVLGTMLFNGDGVPRDYPRAYALMTRASAAGLPSASQTLAQMDDYITPADRERGTALAQRYAAQAQAAQTAAPTRPGSIRTTDVAPSRTPEPTVAPRGGRRPAAVASPMPPPVQVPRPVPAAAGKPMRGGWRIQLGAFRDRGNAEALWSRLRGRLGGAQPSYTLVGGVTRLQAGGYPSKAEATRACAAAKAAGAACVVVAP